VGLPHAVGWQAAAALALAACGGGPLLPEGASEQRWEVSKKAEVVSTVDGHPVTDDELRGLVRAATLSPAEALSRLQAERALMLEASRRGYAGRAEVTLATEQAAIHALLDEEAAAVQVSDEELAEAYDRQRNRFVIPERRRAVHVLAKLPADADEGARSAARAFIEQRLEELRQADDPVAYVTGTQRTKTAHFEVLGEALPMAAKGSGAFVKPFMEALFESEQVGVVPRPVETSFGIHGIGVVEIVAAVDEPLSKVAGTLRQELLLKKREERIEALIAELTRTHGVEVAAGAREALGELELR